MHFTVHEREKKMLANRENVCVLAFDRAPTGSLLFPPHLRGSEAHRRKRERGRLFPLAGTNVPKSVPLFHPLPVFLDHFSSLSLSFSSLYRSLFSGMKFRKSGRSEEDRLGNRENELDRLFGTSAEQGNGRTWNPIVSALNIGSAWSNWPWLQSIGRVVCCPKMESEYLFQSGNGTERKLFKEIFIFRLTLQVETGSVAAFFSRAFPR